MRYSCPFQKQKHIAKDAQQAYETLRVESREDIPLRKEQLNEAVHHTHR